MGIEGLLQALKPITKKTHIRAYAHKTAAIDASAWLYKGAYSCSWELSQGFNTSAYMHFAFNMIRLLQLHSVSPIFVFDGLTLPLKEETVKRRSEEKRKYRDAGDKLLQEGDVEGAKTMFSRSIFIRSAMTYRLIDLLDYMHIRYVVSPYEADAELAYLCQTKVADFAISEDSDILVYGCEDLMLKLDNEGNCETITLKKSLKDPETMARAGRDEFIKDLAEMTPDQFIELCIVAGCDYLKNIPGIGLKRAIKFLRDAPLDEALETIATRSQYQCKIPKNYGEDVHRITLQFKYGLAIELDRWIMTTLNPLPSNLNQNQLDLVGLGRQFPAELVEPYAKGVYDMKKGAARERLKPAELEKIKHELETFRGTTKPSTPAQQVGPIPKKKEPTAAAKKPEEEIAKVVAASADPKDQRIEVVKEWRLEEEDQMPGPTERPNGRWVHDPEEAKSQAAVGKEESAQKAVSAVAPKMQGDTQKAVKKPGRATPGKDEQIEDSSDSDDYIMIDKPNKKTQPETAKNHHTTTHLSSPQKRKQPEQTSVEEEKKIGTKLPNPPSHPLLLLNQAERQQEAATRFKKAKVVDEDEDEGSSQTRLKELLLRGIQELDRFFGLPERVPGTDPFGFQPVEKLKKDAASS